MPEETATVTMERLKIMLGECFKQGYIEGRKQGAQDQQAIAAALLQRLPESTQYQAGYTRGRADALREIQPLIMQTAYQAASLTLQEQERRQKRERGKRGGAPSRGSASAGDA